MACLIPPGKSSRFRSTGALTYRLILHRSLIIINLWCFYPIVPPGKCAIQSRSLRVPLRSCDRLDLRWWLRSLLACLIISKLVFRGSTCGYRISRCPSAVPGSPFLWLPCCLLWFHPLRLIYRHRVENKFLRLRCSDLSEFRLNDDRFGQFSFESSKERAPCNDLIYIVVRRQDLHRSENGF